jgi:hypothetical protein
MYVQPTYSLLLSAQDRRMKEKVLQSDLTYRVTGLADGKKLLHLYPLPASRNEIRNQWGKHYSGRKVWYFYYDTSDKNTDKCKKDNNDIITLPSDAPVDVLQWGNLNSVAQQQVRDFLLAEVKIAIGSIRGFYSGDVSATDKELSMDYRHLLDEGETLKTATIGKLKEQLDKLSQVNMTEERAKIAENLNRERGYQPPRTPIIPF